MPAPYWLGENGPRQMARGRLKGGSFVAILWLFVARDRAARNKLNGPRPLKGGYSVPATRVPYWILAGWGKVVLRKSVSGGGQ